MNQYDAIDHVAQQLDAADPSSTGVDWYHRSDAADRINRMTNLELIDLIGELLDAEREAAQVLANQQDHMP